MTTYSRVSNRSACTIKNFKSFINRSCTFLSLSKKFYPVLLLHPVHFEMDLKESVIYKLSRSKYLLDVEIYDEPCNQIYFLFSYFS